MASNSSSKATRKSILSSKETVWDRTLRWVRFWDMKAVKCKAPRTCYGCHCNSCQRIGVYQDWTLHLSMADDPFKKEQAIENGIYFLKGIKVIILGRRESSVQLRLSPRSSAPAFRLPNILKKNMPESGVWSLQKQETLSHTPKLMEQSWCVKKTKLFIIGTSLCIGASHYVGINPYLTRNEIGELWPLVAH